MVTELQKKTAQAIVNIFETGKPLGDYGMVTVLPGDSGHLTYGRSQTTLGSGNLFLLLSAYCKTEGAAFAGEIKPYLNRVEERDSSLDHDEPYKSVLRRAGDDPVMQEQQDRFFDRVYWFPAVRISSSYGVLSALGISVVYDSQVHGSLRRIAKSTIEKHGLPRETGEQSWIGHYVDTRRNWLATHSNALLHRTVYRMDEFRKLIDSGKWDLSLPISVRGILITESSLMDSSDSPPIRVSAAGEDERLLRKSSPVMEGGDVKEVQEALSRLGDQDVPLNGKYDEETMAAVKRFQKHSGLPADGIVGPATRAELFYQDNTRSDDSSPEIA